MTKTVLIAGASGKFGAAAVTAFEAAGWNVRRFKRDQETLKDAAVGVDVIVNALNPPNYENWDTEIPRITAAVIDAAKATGATVLVPGNVYNFGDQPAPWSSRTPQHANSSKGQIRIDMEDAYRQSGVRTIILRAGDFLGDGIEGAWLDLVMLKSVSNGKFTYPGGPDVPHAWAYLPDLARAAVLLAEKRTELARFQDVSFPGYAVTGAQFQQALEQAIGRTLKFDRMAWWPIRLVSPIWKLGRSLLEMRYLWDHPHWLDGAAFAELLPEFEATPIGAAIARSLPADIQPDQAMIRTQALA